jgi:hypothetical protein
MRKRRLWQFVLLALITALTVNGNSNQAWAVTSNSHNYQITETQLGGGSSSQSCSEQYCAQASIGDLSSGKAASTKGSATFGPAATGSDPLLEVIVEPGVSNLGVLTTETTASKTTTIQVRNYLSDGYVLQIIGDPPKYADHIMDTSTTPQASTPGKEQFAINAVANTTPPIGAGLLQVPSDQTSFGVVNDAYKTPNLFKYMSGDVIAHSSSESGQTNYTVSMIINISNQTPAGHFTSDFSAVVIPVY